MDTESVMVAGVRYSGKKIVIATGSRPRPLSIPGIESAHVCTNETIFSLQTFPKRLVVLGMGPIGVELGQAFALLGSHVTMVGSKLLEKEDPEIVSVLQKSLEKNGIEFMFGYKPVEMKDAHTLVLSNEKGEKVECAHDTLLVSIGREKNIEQLHLKNGGVEVDSKGNIVVDSYLRTSNPRVFVCGDVAGGHQFTHAAELHASIIIRNFFAPLKKKLNTDAMSWVTYTEPEIATFGLDEKTLKERGIFFETITKDFSGDDRAIVDDNTGLLKLRVAKNGTILGGSMVAHTAGELAQELMLAQANSMKISTLLKKVYPYPTATRINRTVALEYLGRSLTNTNKKILQWLFR